MHHLSKSQHVGTFPDLQAYDVASLPELLGCEASLLLLSVFHPHIILGVETFGLGLRERSNKNPDDNVLPPQIFFNKVDLQQQAQCRMHSLCTQLQEDVLTIPARAMSVLWTWVWLTFSNRSLASKMS